MEADTELSMNCIVPYPKERSLYPLCSSSRKPRRSTCAFREHARKVHRVLTVNTPTACSACGKTYPQYKPTSTHFSRCKERLGDPNSDLRSQTSTRSLPPSVTSSPNASPPQQYAQFPIIAFAEELELPQSRDRINLASMPQPTPTCLPELTPATPSTPVLSTHESARGYLDAGTPTNNNSLHLFLEDSLLSPTAFLPSQSPTRLPRYISQAKPTEVVEAWIHGLRPLRRPR